MGVLDRIIELTNKKNLTGKDIATVLGLKKSPLTDWKNNKSKPTLEQIITMCEFFAVSSDYLLFGINSTIKITNEEKEILTLYNSLDEKSKTIIKGKLYEYEKENKIK